MEFYFGKVDASKALNLENTDLFKKEDQHFKYKMIFNDEGAVFHNTKDQFMAFDTEMLRELEVAVYVAREYEIANKDAELLKQNRMNNLRSFLQRIKAGSHE